ncbi:MAG: hypothetical protein HRT82_09800 [Henriciella sp.]|nr:hypothetical protein [Henriciella sp.]
MSYQNAKRICLLLPILFGLSPLASADETTKSLTVYNDAVGDAYVSLDQEDGIGNQILWHSNMQTEAGDVIGISAGHCTRLDAADNFFCTFNIELDGRGIIAGQGVQRTEPLNSIYPITGGTGEFERITGTLVSRPVEDRARFIYEIAYRLPEE